MKTILFTLMTIFVAQISWASPTSIGAKDEVIVTVMNAQQVLGCYTAHDSKNDVVRLEAPVTFLAARTYRQVFENANGSVCQMVDKIVEQSFMNFTGFQVTVNSELLLDRSHIIEQASLKIANLGVMQESEMFPVVELKIELSQKLKQTGDDFLGSF